MSMAPADEMGEIEAGEVKVEGVIEATSEMMHDSGDSEDIGTSSRQHYYKSHYVLSHILVYKLYSADVSMKKTSRYFVSRTVSL
jgi:hypothetical protein